MDKCSCPGYVGYPFENRRVKSNGQKLAYSVDKGIQDRGEAHRLHTCIGTAIPHSQDPRRVHVLEHDQG